MVIIFIFSKIFFNIKILMNIIIIFFKFIDIFFKKKYNICMI